MAEKSKKPVKPMQTTKKVKVVGHEQYTNNSTGEIVDMAVVSIEERDFNFHKVWMRDLISKLELVGNAKTKLAYWIIENLNRENQLTMTYRQIADNTGLSLGTVKETMKILLDADFLRKVNMGVYMVNPNLLFKGTRDSRINILSMYSEAEREPAKPQTNQEKLQDLMKTISRLQKQAEKLAKKCKDETNDEAEPEEEEEDYAGEDRPDKYATAV